MEDGVKKNLDSANEERGRRPIEGEIERGRGDGGWGRTQEWMVTIFAQGLQNVFVTYTNSSIGVLGGGQPEAPRQQEATGTYQRRQAVREEKITARRPHHEGREKRGRRWKKGRERKENGVTSRKEEWKEDEMKWKERKKDKMKNWESINGSVESGRRSADKRRQKPRDINDNRRGSGNGRRSVTQRQKRRSRKRRREKQINHHRNKNTSVSDEGKRGKKRKKRKKDGQKR